MSGWPEGVLAAAVAAGFAVMSGTQAAAADERPRSACGAATVARGHFGHAIDGRTFVLDDGREVRLAAIEVPPLPVAEKSADAADAEAARNGLAALLAGAEIVLKSPDPQQTGDRYGRLLGYAFAAGADSERPVQADLLAAGLARVAARVGNRACAAELLAGERAARRAKLGLWTGSYYDLLDAENPADVLAARGRFALVEGKVLSVRESGATIYVNFGRRWTTDFTVTILKRNERSFTAAGLEPKKLAGRKVRVRGWVEERGGPWIEAAQPEQIELTDGE
jgi:endonuclease YncB( thermonuclease family)